jgi:hypothetical protein
MKLVTFDHETTLEATDSDLRLQASYNQDIVDGFRRQFSSAKRASLATDENRPPPFLGSTRTPCAVRMTFKTFGCSDEHAARANSLRARILWTTSTEGFAILLIEKPQRASRLDWTARSRRKGCFASDALATPP